jgi:hypothetical protein
MHGVPTTVERSDQRAVANDHERHPLTSFRPLTLLLLVCWVLVIAAFASPRLRA